MDEDFIQFIREQREAYVKATGQLPNDESVSRYALAYQLALLNVNIEEVVAPLIESEEGE